MSLAQMINRPCVLVKRVAGEKDELGNETTEPVEIETVCDLQQQGASSFRSESDDEVSDTRWVLYLPADVEAGVGDAVRVSGDGEFEVYGEAWKVWNPHTQTFSHIEAAVRRTVAPDEPSEGDGS
jgi:hypothetical protein